MCTSTILVKNSSKSFHPRYSSLFNKCECGRCGECRDFRTLSWQVRAYYEYLHTIKQRGKVFYYTLTFNNYWLPRFQGIKCFDWDLVDKFVKRFRQSLSYHFGCEMKLLLTSEYGDLFKRPHHHVLFFLTGDKLPSAMSFRSLLQDAWSHFDSSSNSRYPYGFIKEGKFGAEVVSHEAVLYVCKYVCKDLSFLGNSFGIFRRLLKQYLQLLPSDVVLPRLSDIRSSVHAKELLSQELYDLRADFLRTFKHLTPFVKYSLGFGASSLDSLDSQLIERESILLPHGDVFKEVPLPQYLMRKLFYERVFNSSTGKNDLYRLSWNGFQHFRKKYSDLSNDIQNNDTLYSLALSQYNECADFEPLFQHYYQLRDDLPVFNRFYRYYVQDACSLIETLDNRIDHILVHRSILPTVDVFDVPNFKYLESHLYSRCSDRFKLLEDVQNLLDMIYLDQKRLKYLELQKKRDLQKKVKDSMKLRDYLSRVSSSPHAIRYKPLKFTAYENFSCDT